MIKKTLKWNPEYLFDGKAGKRLWKQIRKAKSKKKLNEVLFTLAWKLESLDSRLVELKKFIGDRREY